MLDAHDARLKERILRDPDDEEAWTLLARHVARSGRLPDYLEPRTHAARIESLLARSPERQDLARLWARVLGLAPIPRGVYPVGSWWRRGNRLGEDEEHDYDRESGKPLYVEEPETRLVFAWIPPGEFWMGSADDDPRGLPHERPRHPVRVERGFYLGVSPVPARVFDAVVRGAGEIPGGQLVDPPATGVRWLHAIEFCRALSARWGAGPRAGWEPRLPSEAEWEYACRGGDSRDPYAERLDVLAWHVRNSAGHVQGNGEKGPNPWGLHDMLGNVWEWCLDRFHPDFLGAPEHGEPWYEPETADQDPDEIGERVLRGGSVKQSPEELTVTARKGRDARLHPRNSTCSLRCLLSPVARPLEPELAGRVRMNTEEALTRLRGLSEIPPEEPLEEETVELFEDILRHFMDRQDTRCIVPLLEVFQGEPDDARDPPSLLDPGEHELPEDERYDLAPQRIWGAMLHPKIFPVLEAHPREAVLEGLRLVLESSDPGLRIRALDLPLFSEELSDLYRTGLRAAHPDERYLAATKIQRVCGPEDLAAVREAYEDEPEERIRLLLDGILEEHQ